MTREYNESISRVSQVAKEVSAAKVYNIYILYCDFRYNSGSSAWCPTGHMWYLCGYFLSEKVNNCKSELTI